MNMFFVALASITISVAAQFFLKAGMSGIEVKAALSHPFSVRTVLTILTDKAVVGGFVLYGLGALVWLKVLAQWDVSKAYPLVGLGFAMTLGIGLMMGEQISGFRILGVLLICVGVWIVASS